MYIDYEIGDVLVRIDNPNEEIGVCTGFTHNNTCVCIDGSCFGGKQYFMKSEIIDYEIVTV